MALLQAHTANLSPHPAPVAPLADQYGQEGDEGLRFLSALADRCSDAGACARVAERKSRNKDEITKINVVLRQFVPLSVSLRITYS